MTDTATAVAWGGEALTSVPRGYLAGKWRHALDDATFVVEDPSTEEPVASVADCSGADALTALDAAASVAENWACSPPRQRADVLHRLADALLSHRERCARLLTVEVGKTIAEARGEVAYSADYVRWYAEETVRPHGRSTAAPNGRNHIITVAEPVGPCLLITPWNVPLAMAARKVAPALAAGCTAILKPAELTPLTSLVFGELALESGVPSGVLSVVTTSRPADISAALLCDPRMRKVSFTGSTPVGRRLLELSGQRVLRTSMELGGNAPFVVFDDADLDVAVREAMVAKMRMGGQSCVAANRFLVQEGVADAFVSAFGEQMAAVAVGPPSHEGSDLGPLVDRRAVEKVHRLVDDAVAKGAVVVARAQVPERCGHYVSPTVLDHVPEHAQIMHEEVFGPVAAIHRFSAEAEAVRIANDTEHGLAAFVLTRDIERARRVASRIETGMVGLNRGLVSDVAAPFGGVKQSGLGREGGPEGLQEYQQLKYFCLPSLGASSARKYV